MKKIEVFLRHCYYSHLQYSSQNRPDWWDKEKVFENFKRTLNPETTNYTIIYDKHHGERENTFLKNEENVYEIDCGKESLSFIYILHMICGGLMKVVLVYYIHYQTKENEKRNEDKRMGENIGLHLQRLLYC